METENKVGAKAIWKTELEIPPWVFKSSFLVLLQNLLHKPVKIHVKICISLFSPWEKVALMISLLMLNLTSHGQFLLISSHVSASSSLHLHFAYLSDKTENILSQERKEFIIKEEINFYQTMLIENLLEINIDSYAKDLNPSQKNFHQLLGVHGNKELDLTLP